MGVDLQSLDPLLYPVGTPVTITLWQGADDGMHYSSTVFNSSLLLPSTTALGLVAPTAPKAGTAPTFTVTTKVRTPDGVVAVPGVSVAVQTRTATGAWVTRARGLTSSSGVATLRIPALREGVYARSVVLLGSAKASASKTVVHNRVVTATLSKPTVAHGQTATLSGATVGAAAKSTVVIERCTSATSLCTTYKTLTTGSTYKYAVTVAAPTSAGKSYWYRARLPKLSALTPGAVSPRVRLLAS